MYNELIIKYLIVKSSSNFLYLFSITGRMINVNFIKKIIKNKNCKTLIGVCIKQKTKRIIIKKAE